MFYVPGGWFRVLTKPLRAQKKVELFFLLLVVCANLNIDGCLVTHLIRDNMLCLTVRPEQSKPPSAAWRYQETAAV